MSSEIERALARVPYFEGLGSDALALLAEVADEEAFAEGALLFGEDDPADRLFVVTAGTVTLLRAGDEGTRVEVVPGDVLGDRGLLDDAPRAFTARAASKVRAVVMNKAAFDEVLFLHRDIAYEVLWAASQKLARRVRSSEGALRPVRSPSSLEGDAGDEAATYG